MNQSNFAIAIELSLIAIGGIIMGAACVGIQLDKVKKQRAEDKRKVQEILDRLQGEAGYATGGEVDKLVFSGLDVHEMLNEIEFVMEAQNEV